MSKVQRVPKLEKATYMFVCLDGEKSSPLRKQHMFGHLDHIEANNDKYRLAGPMRRSADGDIYGSFFLIEADSEQEAWDVMNGDPYIDSGMYETITVSHIMPACGKMLGGVIWDQDEIRANLEKYT